MLEQVYRKLFVTIIASVLTVALFGQAGKKNWKPGEYDLYSAVTKATDLNQKLAKLNDWKDKFKDSDYADIRQQLYLDTYQKMNKLDDVLRVGSEILSANPKDLRTLYIMNISFLQIPSPSPDAMAMAEKAAHPLADAIDQLKPPGVSDADWAKSKRDVEALGHTVLGKIAMLRKDNDTAEKEFGKSLEINSGNGQVSYWLGRVELTQKTIEKQSAALYDFARATAYDGPGSLNEQGRKEISAYLEKAYVTFHGDKTGLPELLTQAKTSAMPPAGFKIESAQEIAIRKEEEFKKTNPMLALWMSVRKELTGDNGATYFDSSMKGAALPGGAGGVESFKGKLLGMKPAVNPKELILGIAEANTPEVTLKLDAPMPGKAPLGTEIEFAGVASAFSKDPFMITFDCEKAKVHGWPAQPHHPVHHGARRK